MVREQKSLDELHAYGKEILARLQESQQVQEQEQAGLQAKYDKLRQTIQNALDE